MKSGRTAKPAVADVTISEAARSDLVAIDDYGTDTFGRDAADAFHEGLRRVFARLSEYPRSAPERSDYGKDIRCTMHRGYRVLYRFDGSAILIVRVLHHSRDVRRALGE